MERWSRIILAIVFVLANFTTSKAREYNHQVTGRVVDNMTGKAVRGIRVNLMRADSTLVASIDSVGMSENPEFDGQYVFSIRTVGHYIVKATCDGYDDGYVNFELRNNRERSIFVPNIRLTHKSRILPDVLIKATKIKMLMKGDTIVYNADAFNLNDGSMLDALVSRLPGVRLTKDGQIYVNGRYIQSLLINGQDFFGGNSKQALENLPAYTVNKIKVYEKAGRRSELMKRDMHDQIYTMDVRLKKEYSSGTMGNAEAGIGTSDRYRAKIFAMQFSENRRIMAFTNRNNLNDNQQAGLLGEWSPQDLPAGLTSIQSAGMSCGWIFKPLQFWFTTNNIFAHTSNDNESRSSTQTYLTGGDSFRRTKSTGTANRTTWQSNNILVWYAKNYSLSSNLSLDYQQFHGRNSNFSEISDSVSLLNQLLSQNANQGNSFNVNFHHEGTVNLVADIFRWSALVTYNDQSSDLFSLNDLQYTNHTLRDYRDNYHNQSNQTFKAQGYMAYEWLSPNRTFTPEYSYQYTCNKKHDRLYRLDQLADFDSTRFNLLPSTAAALNAALNRGNSYRYREDENKHVLAFSITGDERWLNGHWLLKLPLCLIHKHLNYERVGQQDISRERLFFEPNLSVIANGRKLTYELNADISSKMSDLTSMVNYRDDSDPLNIWFGNPDLHDIHQYNTTLTLRRVWHDHHSVNLAFGYHQFDNEVAYGIVFDKEKGVSTYLPMNVNGNRNADVQFGYLQSFDKKQRFIFDNSFGYYYNHNVDLASVAGQIESQKSIVQNHQLTDHLKFDYRYSDHYSMGFHVSGNYYFITSRRKSFENIHAGDYSMGVNAQVELLWHLQLLTDISLFARRGYQQSEMNTTDWVWNAQLIRSFFHGNLLAKLQGFDILHQLSNTSYVLNAQGRTESWNNSIPRYFMISLAWRFNVMPKKKEAEAQYNN